MCKRQRVGKNLKLRQAAHRLESIGPPHLDLLSAAGIWNPEQKLLPKAKEEAGPSASR